VPTISLERNIQEREIEMILNDRNAFPFLSTRATLEASSGEAVVLVIFLGAIMGVVVHGMNGGRKMLALS
jgi:hypothetical protein